jgi:predicted nucleic acid-binding protein
VIVVDAGVVVPALADDGSDGDQARGRLRGEVLFAPELLDLEVLSVVRRLLSRGQLPVRRAELALTDLAALPVRRVPHRALLSRCWSLRDNLIPYDAAYVALAEQLDSTLVTADGRLAAAPGLRCEVELLLARP